MSMSMEQSGSNPLAYLRRERQRDQMWTRMFRVEAWIAQDGKCAYCHEPIRREEATADHETSLYKGGSTTRKNVKATCLPCNNTKKSMSAGEFTNRIKSPKPGDSIHIWLAWSRRRIWLRVERACKRIERMVT